MVFQIPQIAVYYYSRRIVKFLVFMRTFLFSLNNVTHLINQTRRGVGMRIEMDKIYCGDSLQVLQTCRKMQLIVA